MLEGIAFIVAPLLILGLLYLLVGSCFGLLWVLKLLERLFPTDPDVERDRVKMALFHEIRGHGGRRRRRRPGSDCSKCMENIEEFPRALE